MYNKTLNATETKEIVLDGVNTIDGSVGSTLGPGGRAVIIQGKRGERIVATKDGVSVANAINYEDPKKQLAIDLITQAAGDANARGGDGTTTCTIFTCSLIRNSMDLPEYDTIVAAKYIREWLTTIPTLVSEKFSLPCKDLDFLTSVTTISANSDRGLGSLIATAIHETEGKAKITVVNNGVRNDTIKRVEEAQWGARFSGLTQMVTVKGARVALIEGTVSAASINLLNRTNDTTPRNRTVAAAAAPIKRVPTILLCDKIEAGASAAIARLADRGIYFGVLPGIATVRTTHLADLSNVLDIIPSVFEDSLESLYFKKVDTSITISNQVMRIFLDEETSTRGLALVKRLEDSLEAGGADGRQRNLINSRLDIWSPNYYELDLAAVSAVERKERLDRAEDCINASRNAYTDGVIPGGGVIGLYLINELASYDMPEFVKELITKMLSEPFARIGKNMGFPLERTAERRGEFQALINSDVLYCYDAIGDEYVNCRERQIFDPVVVFESALEAAISLGLVVATTGGSIIIDRILHHADDGSSNNF